MAAFIEWFATTLGLSGAVPAPTQTLWYPLAIAYMATVTVLAWQCGGDPALSAPYRALLAAKVGSTLGFLALAPRGGAVWVLLAAGDAFVAFTLWFTRRTA